VIDEEIQRIISEMEERTRQLLESNQDKLNALAQALLEEETLTNEEVDEIIGVDTEKKEENRP
jgi:cell division protease FtsH